MKGWQCGSSNRLSRPGSHEAGASMVGVLGLLLAVVVTVVLTLRVIGPALPTVVGGDVGAYLNTTASCLTGGECLQTTGQGPVGGGGRSGDASPPDVRCAAWPCLDRLLPPGLVQPVPAAPEVQLERRLRSDLDQWLPAVPDGSSTRELVFQLSGSGAEVGFAGEQTVEVTRLKDGTYSVRVTLRGEVGTGASAGGKALVEVNGEKYGAGLYGEMAVDATAQYAREYSFDPAREGDMLRMGELLSGNAGRSANNGVPGLAGSKAVPVFKLPSGTELTAADAALLDASTPEENLVSSVTELGNQQDSEAGLVVLATIAAGSEQSSNSFGTGTYRNADGASDILETFSTSVQEEHEVLFLGRSERSFSTETILRRSSLDGSVKSAEVVDEYDTESFLDEVRSGRVEAPTNFNTAQLRDADKVRIVYSHGDPSKLEGSRASIAGEVVREGSYVVEAVYEEKGTEIKVDISAGLIAKAGISGSISVESGEVKGASLSVDAAFGSAGALLEEHSRTTQKLYEIRRN